MKTIEERARQFALETTPYVSCLSQWQELYKQIASEQKEIDDAELARMRKAWEKEAAVNHDTAMAYKQGRHDAIDKACEWLMKNNINYITTDGKVIPAYDVVQDFRKAMEE